MLSYVVHVYTIEVMSLVLCCDVGFNQDIKMEPSHFIK